MSDKCLKCGAEFDYFDYNWKVFKCHSVQASEERFVESEVCTLRQTIALKDKEIAELRERSTCFHPTIYLSEESDNYYCVRCRAGMGTAFYQIARELEKLRASALLKDAFLHE